MIEVELKEWGNSVGVIIPVETLRELRLKEGDTVAIEFINKKRMDGFGICRGAKSFKEEKESHKEF